MARYCKLLLLVFVLTSCGQPLVMRTTPRATQPIRQTPRPTQAAALVTPDVPETTTALPVPPTASVTAEAATAEAAPPTFPVTVVVVQPQQRPTPTNDQRWQAQQLNRQPFEPPRQYIAQRGTTLFWYDPRTGQRLEIGTLLGEFTATAMFTWRDGSQPALLVPYQINSDYGLTAVSDALLRRMSDAGEPERVEAFVLISDAVQPK